VSTNRTKNEYESNRCAGLHEFVCRRVIGSGSSGDGHQRTSARRPALLRRTHLVHGPFCFKRKEAVPQGVRRLAAERIEAALDSLKDYRSAESVRGVRKDIKRVRAVLRLARERIPKKAYRRQTEWLREAADRLAPTRDAYVKGAALRNLREHFHDQLGHAAFRQLRKQMEGDLVQADAGGRRSVGSSTGNA
jgi:CHAD domain